MLIGQIVDTVNHFIWHRQRCCMWAIEYMPSLQAEEKIVPLRITGRMQCKCPDSPRLLQSVVVLLMCLHICTVLILDVFGTVNVLANYNGSWPQGIRDPTIMWIPPSCGNVFSQKTLCLTNLMTILPGIFSKGSIQYTLRHLSFTVHRYCSISPTCSSHPASFRYTPHAANSPRSGENLPSIIMVYTLKPPLPVDCQHFFDPLH